MNGYDMDLVSEVTKEINLPFTILGGAGNLNDVKLLTQKHHPCGVSASSIFVFKGKHKAVLIQYPTEDEKEKIMSPKNL